MIRLARQDSNVNGNGCCWLPAWLAASVLLLSACGGGGSDDNGGTQQNRAPTANAGADVTVNEQTLVTLTGSGSDPDSDSLTFSWTQTAGVPVTLTGASTATLSFTAPALIGGQSITLDFQLTVSDGSLSSMDTVVVTVQEPQATVTVSGKVQYEFVPPNLNCRGLNFLMTETRPIRAATVQLIDDTTDTVIASMPSSEAGDYMFTNVDADRMVRLRVRAELKRAGSPSWDVEVRDNVDTSMNPPPLASRPLYVLDGAAFSTGTADVNRDLTATTGWGGTSYTGPRSAAPFAVLDSMYSAIQFVLTTDPSAAFAPLDAFWSVNNTLVENGTDIDAGELPASFYTTDPERDFIANPSLFLLGDANTDTEEFDDHVIVHEWGHYFEDNFSRSDSPGGSHAIGNRLDARLAFGEGWATALAAMALDNPSYCDTGRPGTMEGFEINAEGGFVGPQGWFNEVSVVRLLYDIWDTTNEGTDTGSIGFDEIYLTMIGRQVVTPAFTTIFSFATELRAMLDASGMSLLDSQLLDEQISPLNLNIWGDGATNDANGGRDVLPIYTDLTANGSTINICVNDDYDPGRTGNKLATIRYLRINVPATTTYNVSVVTTTTAELPPDDPDDPSDQSDPDIGIYLNGSSVLPLPVGLSGEANEEIFTTPVLAGPNTYVADITEFRYADPDTDPNFPDRMCFDVTMTPN